MKRGTRTLLEPGNEAAWAQINDEHDQERKAATGEMTVAERVDRGLVLSELAHEITSALSAAGSRGGTA